MLTGEIGFPPSDKYKDFIWPFEEADWHGLPLAEALHKAHSIDRIGKSNF